MIGILKNWLSGMIAAAICLAILDALVPKGAIKGIGKVTAGLVMFLVMLQPWQQVDPTALEVRFDIYQRQIDGQIATYRNGYHEQMGSIIKENTGAYISEKAESMGVACRAEVETALRDGVPIPVSVTLSTVYKEALSVWITQEIGISPEQQYWEVGS